MKQIRGDVDLADLYLKEIPSILNDVVIEGDFDISDNNIKNLNNFPAYCHRAYLSRNPLTSLIGIKQKKLSALEVNGAKIVNLEGCPEQISALTIHCRSFNSLYGSLKTMLSYGMFKIRDTQLQTMENCPDGNNVSFVLLNNELTSLVGMPNKCHDLVISNNKLKTLIGCPQHVTGLFTCENNNLESFDGFPRAINGDVTMTTSRMFNNTLMESPSYFESELRKRCKIYGRVLIKRPTGGLI